MRINRFSEARGIFEEEVSLEPHIYCFGGGGGGEGSGGDYSDLGDTGDTGVSASVAAGGQGWGPDNGSNDQSSNDSQDRRVQSTGSTTNVNIDRSQPSVVADVNGIERTVYGTQENLDKAIASGDLQPTGNVQDNYTPGTDAAAANYTPPATEAVDIFAPDVPEFDEPAGAVGLEDVLGYNPFAATPVTQAARGPALGTTDYEFDALGGTSRVAAPGTAALSPEQDARLTAMLAAEGVALPGPMTHAQAAGRQQARDAYRAGMGEGLIEDVDVFDVDALAPVDLDEVPAGALDLAKAGVSPAGSPSQQVTRQATDPAMVGLEGPAVSTPRTAEEMALTGSQTFGTRTAAPGTYTGVGSLQYSPTPASDPLGESIDRAISDFAGYREGQTRTQTPDGVVVDDFMLTRDLVSKAPEYGATYSPLEQLRMQEGTRTVPALNVPDIDVFGAKIPTSIAGRIASDVLTPASAVDRALQAGATPIYDAQGRIEGAVDKYGTVYDASPYDFESSEAMKAAYAEQSRRQEAERGGGDGGGQRLLPPPAPAEPIAGPAEPYQGRDIVGEYNYQPRGPISYAYTGLPSLAPTTLRPSFQARGSYAPLFPMGRRS